MKYTWKCFTELTPEWVSAFTMCVECVFDALIHFNRSSCVIMVVSSV